MDEKENSKILIDVTSLFDQYSKRGIGRYTKDLLLRLIKKISVLQNLQLVLVGFHDLEQNLIEMGFSKFGIEEYESRIHFYSLGEPFPSNYQNVFKWKKFDEIIFEEEPDLYFAPHFERGLPTTPRLKHTFSPKKTVVTVHDVIPLVNNSFSQKNLITNYIKGIFYKFMWRGVEEADLILTSSNFSKKDLIEYGNVSEEDIDVIYLGINETFYKNRIDDIEENTINEVLKRFIGEEKKEYFFYDSGLESNKGIDNLIQIVSKLFEKNSNHIPDSIVIVGGDFYQGKGGEIKARTEIGSHYLKKFKQMNILDKVIATSKISDQELQILLRYSAAYIYFSEYEGFGFGPIQAMAAEIPTIVNESSCLPEITNGASYLVDAKNHEKTVDQVYDFLKNDSLKNELINKGKEVAKSYNWETTADKTLEAFLKLLTVQE